jgi:hypothetical protein
MNRLSRTAHRVCCGFADRCADSGLSKHARMPARSSSARSRALQITIGPRVKARSSASRSTSANPDTAGSTKQRS